MPKNKANYFPHDSNARNSDKLIRLRMRHKSAGYGVYFMILERLREEPNYMSAKDYNMIAFDLREDASLIKSVVEDFGLFVFTEDGKYFYSESFNKRMAVKDEIRDKRSEAGRAAMSKKWGTDSDSDTSNSKLRSQRLKLAREKGTHTRKEWDEMKNFFGECVICGSKENIVKDHIIPLYQGGSDEITNLQPLCSSCNSRKGADNNDYRKEWCESKGIEMPNKWLTKDDETPNKESKEKESKEDNITSLYPPISPPIGEVPLGEVKTYVLTCEQTWLDAIGMNRHLPPGKVMEWLDKFFAELEMNGETHKELKDFKKHFNNWLKIQLEHENSGNRKNTGNSKALREKDTFAQKDYSGGF